ncbi:putative Fe2OG oxygenase family oxidoreductase [Tupanvirus deep ocean]|uniref:Fe2OG oxygenase family oxidoreductase n=2 Tax=Tupanvirus TaxID=2094720 RepID=A0AC62A7J8_9VIRU|nr:putative Fe2OG oxygenase family oxidoreductase [Tupanvirus deep ocean]QKU33711.1 putative Fe2OG oxygenase family oxidoreductase [Tupanvirus deep ocean]
MSKTKSKKKIKEALNLNGFSIIQDYLTEDEELSLANKINKQKWVVDYQRRLQYYNYRNELFEPYDLIPIPDKIPIFLEKIIDKMMTDGIIQERPDQIIINEYKPGEGLKPHFDRKDYYKNVIVGISLLSGTVMEFIKQNPPEKKKIYVPRRSLYIIKDDARYLWKHAIPPRKKDIVDDVEIPRETRISITFRNVIKEKIKHDNIVYPLRHPSQLKNMLY